MAKKALPLLAAGLALCAFLALYRLYYLRNQTRSQLPFYTYTVDPSYVYQLDINIATAQELASLPGIGEVLAKRIVEYREENGAFSNSQELMQIDGLYEGTYQKILPYITVGGT